MVEVINLARTLGEMQGDSIRIICTADEAKGTLCDGDATVPLARVKGFEGSGVRP